MKAILKILNFGTSRSKNEELASKSVELDCLKKECKQLRQDNDDLARVVNKLKVFLTCFIYFGPRGHFVDHKLFVLGQ